MQYIILLVLIVLCIAPEDVKTYEGYSNEPQLTIRLSEKGHCLDPVNNCIVLENCTILHGSLIIRGSVETIEENQTLVIPSFEKLREITGFLVVTFFSQDVFNLLPALSVIRGQQLVQNYAFVIYLNTKLKAINFPSLTTILRGGVRIDRNNKLCYVNSVRWKSIVKDGDQKGKYGIVMKSNNLDCDSACYTDQCYAAAGHANNPKAQFCWGPGNRNDYHCQKFCKEECGLQGCAGDEENVCCHDQCLGGCSERDSPSHCYACRKYRIWESGVCVSQCPKNTYLVDQMFCMVECPLLALSNDNSRNIPRRRRYSLNGECVQDCPEGYRVDQDNKTCVTCDSACPKICELPHQRIDGVQYHGSLVRVPADISNKGLTGCTEIIGSLTFQIQDGTGNAKEFLEGLKTIKIIRGHINVKKSNLKDLNFFTNLELIDPPDTKALIHGRYAIQINDNKNLESLWQPEKTIRVTSGQIFAQYNSRLCPKQIFDLQRMMSTKNGGNVTGHISEQTNGNRVPCEIERLEIQVEEFKPQSPVWNQDSFTDTIELQASLACAFDKCMKVSWNFTKTIESYNIIFYQLYYRKLEENEIADAQVVGAITESTQWKSVEIPRPKDVFKTVVNSKHIIEKLTPYSLYAVFLREFVTVGEERTSRIHYVNISASIPSAPLGLEASYWSSQSVRLKWRKPDSPNGKIIRYNIYWEKTSYSFWEDQLSLDWCKRNIKVTEENKVSAKELEEKNKSCIYEAEKEQSSAVQADRDAYVFRLEFQERINKVVFTKPKVDGQDNSQKSINVKSLLQNENSKKVSDKIYNQDTKVDVDAQRSDANVSGDVYSFLVEGLDSFQSYEFTVCACTEGPDGGCAQPVKNSINKNCAKGQSRTDVYPDADTLGGPVNLVIYDKNQINVTWQPPNKPNAVILKYEISVTYKADGDDIVNIYCRKGGETYFVHKLQAGKYVTRVRAISPAGNGSWSTEVPFEIVAAKAERDNTLVLGVSIGAAILILVLIAFVIYYAFFKRYIEKGVPGVLYASVNPEYMNSNEVYVPDEWELNRETIELLHELGQGSFGMVYEGIAHDINGQAELRVAVKTVNENASIRERIEFLHEASIMKAFQSEHVVRLIGVVSQGQPTFVVMELMARGDLKTFLRSRRPEEKNPTLLPPMRAEMLQMAAEISDGMAYLAARKYVHRDLAARNCMVAYDHTVKIGDFGMARDIYETDYYRKGGKGLLPVRWMAPESLQDGIFTTSSDVWSFGVVLWEIVTLAAQPYQGKTNEEVLKAVIGGGQLEYPPDCDKQMQSFMELCWRRDPKSRPSFLEIVRLLEDDVSQDFVDCSFYHEMKTKALEDTLCQEGNLYELLSRRNSTPRPNINSQGGDEAKERDSLLSEDSGAFIDNCKPEVNPPSSYDNRKSFPIPNERTRNTNGMTGDNAPVLIRSHPPQRRYNNSVYDNLDETMTYGASPVASRNLDRSDNDQNETEELDLKKIFYGKSVAV